MPEVSPLEKVVIIVPTYNEADTIVQTLEELENTFQKITHFDMHVLVYDSCSPDGTEAIVKQHQQRYSNIHLATEAKKTGLGSAYIKAMRYACDILQADIVFEFDADGSHRPEYLPAMLDHFHRGADVVIGSRFVKGGGIPSDWKLNRKILSVMGNRIARIFLSNKIRDYTTGFRGTRTYLLAKIDLENLRSKNYAYKIHLMWEIYLLKAKIIEFPIQFRDRQKGYSKFPRNNTVESLLLIIKLRYFRVKRALFF